MMTLTDRYSNDNKTRTYLRIHDPGHSWLEVPAKDVRDAAGVWDKITAYSPLKRHKFYLEEDCDMGTFYKAMLDNGYSVNIQNVNVDDFDEWLAALCYKMGVSANAWRTRRLEVFFYQVEEFHEPR